jgi:hypothetical protein
MPLAALFASHTPLKDYLDPGPGIAAEVDACLAEARAWVQAFAPELVIEFAPDHFNGFFYQLMPSFCIGAAAESVGDWKTATGPLPVAGELAQQLVESVHADGVDVALSHRMTVDHGFTQLLEILFDAGKAPPLIPVFINCAAPPRPPMARVRALGQAVGRFAASSGADAMDEKKPALWRALIGLDDQRSPKPALLHRGNLARGDLAIRAALQVRVQAVDLLALQEGVRRHAAVCVSAIDDDADELFLRVFLQTFDQRRTNHAFLVRAMATLTGGRTPRLPAHQGLGVNLVALGNLVRCLLRHRGRSQRGQHDGCQMFANHNQLSSIDWWVLQWKKTIFRSKGLHDLRWTGNKCRLMAGAFLNS